jgi:ABC-type Mn2+/Zn2+ transport system permease subunit
MEAMIDQFNFVNFILILVIGYGLILEKVSKKSKVYADAGVAIMCAGTIGLYINIIRLYIQ